MKIRDKTLPALGKIPPEFFDRVIYPRLGAPRPDVIIGPRHGVDYGVIRLADGTCLALSSDPFFIVPAYGFDRAAWFAFHIIVSDVAVSGLEPVYLAVDLNLPPEITALELETMWETVHREAVRYGVNIVTGHTARYAGCNYPMVGGATALAPGPESDLRGPHLVRSGDRLVITKGPAVETTGLLAISFPDRLKAAFGADFQRRAEAIFYQMSVLEDCAVARRFPGVRVMHDATECGIWGGLYEMARAGGFGLLVERERIVTQSVIMETCRHFEIDPFVSISEGTLLVIVAPDQAGALVEAFQARGIPASEAGLVTSPEDGVRVKEAGRVRPLEHPRTDPYWLTVERLLSEG